MSTSRMLVIHQYCACASGKLPQQECTTVTGACMSCCSGKASRIITSVFTGSTEEGLSLRLKRPKRNKSARLRQSKHQVTAINQIWSMDFVADALFDGRRLRA